MSSNGFVRPIAPCNCIYYYYRYVNVAFSRHKQSFLSISIIFRVTQMLVELIDTAVKIHGQNFSTQLSVFETKNVDKTYIVSWFLIFLTVVFRVDKYRLFIKYPALWISFASDSYILCVKEKYILTLLTFVKLCNKYPDCEVYTDKLALMSVRVCERDKDGTPVPTLVLTHLKWTTLFLS